MINRVEQYKTRLDAYLAAEMAILDGAQSYSIGSRNLTRANLSEIRAAIDDLISAVAKEESRVSGRGTHRVMGVIPRDV